MGFNGRFVAFAIITCLAGLVISAGDDRGSFIFPPNSTVTNFALHAPVVAKIGSVHWNDDITVEYTMPDTVKAVWLSQLCYDSLSDTNSSSEEYTGSSFSSTGIFNESTSNLAWNLGNGTGEGSYPNYCMFMLFDYTLQKCSWGPFGLLEWDQGGSFQVPLLYSEMFKILPPNSTEPALITNTAKTTKQSPAPVTATQGNITCPPSGIPASPITTVAPQMEMIPPLANNVTFPAWVYPTYIE